MTDFKEAAEKYAVHQSDKTYQCPACAEQTFWPVGRDDFIAGAEHGYGVGKEDYAGCSEHGPDCRYIEERDQVKQKLQVYHDDLCAAKDENSLIKQELAVARERLGPAGYKIVQEVAELRTRLNEWKCEYNNLCKFANDLEAECDQLKQQLAQALTDFKKVNDASIELHQKLAERDAEIERLSERQMHEGKHVCNGVNIIDGLRTRLQDAEEIMRKYSEYCDREEVESGCRIYGCAESRAYFAKYKATK